MSGHVQNFQSLPHCLPLQTYLAFTSQAFTMTNVTNVVSEVLCPNLYDHLNIKN